MFQWEMLEHVHEPVDGSWYHMLRQTQKAVAMTDWGNTGKHMGLFENSLPLNPMVNDHYPY